MAYSSEEDYRSRLPRDIQNIINTYVSPEPLFRKWASELWFKFYLLELGKRAELYNPEAVISSFYRSFMRDLENKPDDFNRFLHDIEEFQNRERFMLRPSNLSIFGNIFLNIYGYHFNDLLLNLHYPFSEQFLDHDYNSGDFDYVDFIDPDFLGRLSNFVQTLFHTEFPSLIPIQSLQ